MAPLSPQPARPPVSAARGAQWGAAAALLAIAFGAAGALLERPWPTEPAAFTAFLAEQRLAIVAQSALFMLGASMNLWFLGTLRSFLVAGGSERLSHVVFGAGLLWVGLNIVGQAPQITLTLPSQAALEPGLARLLADLCFVMLNLANLPLAVMFAATAAVAFRTRVFPAWLAWLAVFASVAALVLSLGVAIAKGPLAPQGWLTIVLYPSSIIWLLPAAIVMIKRLGRAMNESPTPHHLGRMS